MRSEGRGGQRVQYKGNWCQPSELAGTEDMFTLKKLVKAQCVFCLLVFQERVSLGGP